MPLRTHSRPDLPYDGQAKHNDNKYAKLSSRKAPIPAELQDAEMNYVMDSLDQLSEDIEAAVIGNIPGADDDANEYKFLTTNGTNLSWDFVRPNNIFDGSVTTDKMEDRCVTTEKLENSSVTTDKIANEEVTTDKIANLAITENKYADDSIPSSKIKDSAITTSKYADDSIPTGKLQDDCITTNKIEDEAITEDKMGQASVGTGTLIDLCVTSPKIANDSVSTEKIPNSAITTEKINDLSVTTQKIANQNITKEKLNNNIFVPFALLLYDGDNQQIIKSFNINNVVRNSTGNYTITFANPASNENFIYSVQSMTTGSGVHGNIVSKNANQLRLGFRVTYNDTSTDMKFCLIVYDMP